MAYGYDPYEGTIFGNKHNGGDGYPHDDDYDGNPGSDENSAAFDRKYNRDGYNEFTNLPEIDERQEIARFERDIYTRDNLDRQSEFNETMRRVQYWPHAGRFIIPRQKDSFQAHLALVREGNTVDIQFDPKTYKYFDKIIADHANKPELFNPNHPDYLRYETLRENLAVLRNDMMGIYMDDGSFDPGDEKYLPRLAQIGAEIGDALNADNRWKKSLFPALDTDIANIEGEGAGYIYEYLLSRQTSNTMLGKVWAAIKRFLGQPDNQWNLPPIETTPYSQQGLSIIPAKDELTKVSAHEMRQRAAEQEEELKLLIDPTDEWAVKDISSLQRREAIKHGRTIIEWLKNIQFTDKSLQEFVDTSRPGGLNPDRDAMGLMVDAYYSIMESALHSKPSLIENPKVQQGNQALHVIEHSLELMAKLENPNSQQDAMDIGTQGTKEPGQWNELSKKTVQQLMDSLKGGLETAVSELGAEQQEMDMAQEAFANQQAEEALAMQRSYMAKRAKKQKGPTQQQRVDMALRADDRVAGQGAYSEDEGERIARLKKSSATPLASGRDKISEDNATKSEKAKPADESMEQKIARAKAMKQNLSVNNVGGKPVDSALVKQLGKQLMAMQQQAAVAASEVADVKGGGIGASESFKDRQDYKPPKGKPQIG